MPHTIFMNNIKQMNILHLRNRRAKNFNSLLTSNFGTISTTFKKTVALCLSFAESVVNDTSENQFKELIDKVLLKNSLESVRESFKVIRGHVAIDRNIHTCAEDHEQMFISSINKLSEFIGDFSNSILFRHVTVDGRVLSIINRNLPPEFKTEFKKNMYSWRIAFQVLYYGFGDTATINKCVHGFMRQKSCKTNATEHVRSEAMINFDIAKFFHSTTTLGFIKSRTFGELISYPIKKDFFNPDNHTIAIALLNEKITMSISNCISLLSFLINSSLNFLTHNGRLPTGACYSPMLGNIYLHGFDTSVIKHLNTKFHNTPIKFKYTRYADDVTISTDKHVLDDKYVLNMELVKDLETILNGYGLFIKYDKTRICGKRDKKIVTGVTIDTTNKRLTLGASFRRNMLELLGSKTKSELSPRDVGVLAYVKSVNQDLYRELRGSIRVEEEYTAQFHNTRDTVNLVAGEIIMPTAPQEQHEVAFRWDPEIMTVPIHGPTPEQIEAFVNRQTADAERLLQNRPRDIRGIRGVRGIPANMPTPRTIAQRDLHDDFPDVIGIGQHLHTREELTRRLVTGEALF